MRRLIRETGFWSSGIWCPDATGPLIADDANTVAHVTWNGSALVDSFGNTWTQNGTVPQVPRAGRTPAGAGAFSDVNYYSLGTGDDVLDFAGDFSIALVIAPSAADIVAPFAIFVSNGLYQTAGYFAQWGVTGAGRVQFYLSTTGVGNAASTTNATTAGTVSVVCIGRTGTTPVAKLNLGTLATGVSTAITAATTQIAKLGRYEGAGRSMTGTLYEAWFSSTTPSDALFTAIANRVKARAGISAW